MKRYGLRRKREERLIRKTKNEILPETKRAVIFIFLLVASALTLLSTVGLAGSAGNILNEALTALLGRTRVIVPAIFLVLAAAIIAPERINAGFQSKIGLALFLISLNGTIHLIEKKTDPFAGVLGEGGGYLGIITAYPMIKFMGYWAAMLMLSAMTMVGVFLTFSLTVKHILYALNIPRASSKTVWSWTLAIFKNKNTNYQELYGYEAIPRHEDFSSRSLAGRPKEEHSGKESAGRFPIRQEKAASGRPKRSPVVVPMEFLHDRKSKPSAGDIDAAMERIRKTLENFGIAVEMGDVSVGPTVTQYTLKPAEGVKLARITALGNDLALALAAHPIRIEAPIPGKSLVGIEVPNQTIATVGLREILEAPQFKERKSSLVVALGKDVAGHPWLADLGKMPHLLVAGSTGSGKTVCLNAIITSLLYANNSDILKLILVDPKRVELTCYNNIPHLMTPVITDVPKTVNALKWSISEMDRRFDVLQKAGHRDIISFNKIAEEPMPYLVIVIDELADLMVAAASEVEASIIRLAQMSRAVGIHLVLATQRPSVDIITGLIKANITSRIAFAVASQTDSRTILDTSGAEKLLGRGDMLFISAELSKPKRLQGAYVADEEINRVADFWKSQGEPEYDNNILEKKHLGGTTVFDSNGDDDPLLHDAEETVVRAGKASASLLQRRLKVGYARAARLLDIMEEHGIIGPGDGAKPREILVAGPEIVEDIDPNLKEAQINEEEETPL